jgi:hypothetical protein
MRIELLSSSSSSSSSYILMRYGLFATSRSTELSNGTFQDEPTPWSRGLLEKLTVSQLFEKFPAFYGAGRFITESTRARHLSLS